MCGQHPDPEAWKKDCSMRPRVTSMMRAAPAGILSVKQLRRSTVRPVRHEEAAEGNL